MYIFIDPGQNTGWALFDNEGKEFEVTTTRSFEHTADKIRLYINATSAPRINHVIVEQFKLYPWKANDQYWSQFEEVQVIGAVRARCREFNVKYDTVPSGNYSMGFRYLGMNVPKHSHPLHDQMVAMAHGVFWLQNKGIRQPAKR